MYIPEQKQFELKSLQQFQIKNYQIKEKMNFYDYLSSV